MHAEWNQWIWDILTITPTDDERAIKRAYSVQLKTTRPEEDADKFQRLRQAYDAALSLARHARDSAHVLLDHAAGEAKIAADTAAPHEIASAAEIDNVRDDAPVFLQTDAVPSTPAIGAELPPPANAATVWEDFLRGYLRADRNSLLYRAKDELRKVAESESCLNLDFADAFELCAARYCAGDDADEDLRDTLVEHFGWQNDSAHLDTRQGSLSHLVLGRFRADAMVRFLRTKSDAGKVLLEKTPPRFSWKLYDKKFVTELQQVIQGLRWRSPETIWYRLNPEVVNWWETQLTKPRVFSITIKMSLVLGFVLAMAIFMVLAFGKISLPFADGKTEMIAVYVLGQVLGWTVGLVLQFGTTPLMKVLSFRHTPRAQLGWMPVFGVLALLLALGIGSASVNTVLTVCLYCVIAFVFYASTAQLTGLGWLVAGLLILFSAFAMESKHSALSAGLPWQMYLPVAVVCVRGGHNYYAMLDPEFKNLFKIRLVWMAVSAIGLAAFFLNSNIPPTVVTTLGYLMFLPGLLLVNCYFNQIKYPVYPFFALVLAEVIMIFSHRVVVSSTNHDAEILSLWLATFIYMLINMAMMKLKKRQFS
jgi:hypothetical protein